MTYRFRHLIMVPYVIAVLMLATMGLASAGDAPLLIKGKFGTPVNKEAVIADWKARGYTDWANSLMATNQSDAWVSPHNCLRTILEGRVEFIIDGQRFVLEPGDELFYPANAMPSARNLHEGNSKMLIARIPE